MPSIAVDARVLQKTPYTGVNRYLVSLLTAWKELGISGEVKLYFNQYKSLPHERGIQGYSLEHYRLPSKLLTASFMLFRYPNAGRFVNERVLFMPNAHHISWDDARPLVIAVHDISFILFPEHFGLKQRIWHHLLKFHSLMKRADLIITDSLTTARDLHSLFPELNHNRLVTIPLGVDPIYFELPGNALHVETTLPQRFILYVGTLEPRKNVVSIIHAFNALAEQDHSLFLVLAGAVGWRSNPIFSAIRRSPFRDRISYKSYVSETEKMYLYRHASVFVFPSFYEGFGLPPLEAMAAGCPVVASAAGSLPEVLGDAALLVSPFHTGELIHALRVVLNDHNLSSALRKEGIRRAERFSWTETGKKTYDVIRCLIE